MTAKERAVTDEQIGQFTRKMMEFLHRLTKGVVPFGPTMVGLQFLVEGKKITPLKDPLAEYRAIDDLIIIGPWEIENVFLGLNGENSLGLKPCWCPYIPVPKSVEEIRNRVELAKKWGTTATLFLDFPEVDGQPTSLVNQFKWFSEKKYRDDLDSGIVRKLMCIDQSTEKVLRKKHPWIFEPSVKKLVWKIKYGVSPDWSRELIWEEQKKVTHEHCLTVSTATSHLLYSNIMAGAGYWWREHMCERTSTFENKRPLFTASYEDDRIIHLYCTWAPEIVDPKLGVAVEEVL